MGELEKELQQLEIRKAQILYEMYVIEKYDLTNNDKCDK